MDSGNELPPPSRYEATPRRPSYSTRSSASGLRAPVVINGTRGRPGCLMLRDKSDLIVNVIAITEADCAPFGTATRLIDGHLSVNPRVNNPHSATLSQILWQDVVPS